MNRQSEHQEHTLRDRLAIERNDLAEERNVLAIQRNTLANERTFLSYARTSIMAFITGISLFKLFPGNPAIVVLGWISVAASVVIVLIGLWKYVGRIKSLAEAESKRAVDVHHD
jgi:uncharacterized membrane protein YidH (DUF202 family)